MKTRLIGDIHGMFNDYRTFSLRNWPAKSIQLGDFGVGFAGPYWHEQVNDFHQGGDHRFIRGNHDAPTKCRNEMVGWIPDGTVENDVMFIGGAFSVDQWHRTEGTSWWRDEELSILEFERMIDIYATVKPRVMITHDAPENVTNQMFIQSGLAMGGANALKINTRTGMALQAMFDIHQPDFHFFGHWHHTLRCDIGNTTFVCIGELDYIDVDLNNSDQMRVDIDHKFETNV